MDDGGTEEKMRVLQQNAERYYTYTMVRVLDEVLVEDAKQNFARYKQEGVLIGMRDLDYIRVMLISLRKVLRGLTIQDRPEAVLSALRDAYLLPQREFWSLLQTENEAVCRIQQWMERYKPKAEIAQQQRELSPMTSYFRFSEVMERF